MALEVDKNVLKELFPDPECLIITLDTLPVLNDVLKGEREYHKVVVSGDFENFPVDMGVICSFVRNLAPTSVW